MRPALLLVISVFLTSFAHRVDAELTRREWMVDGIKREGLIYLPPAATAPNYPVIFVFHGHGGNMRQAARSMPAHEHATDAMVIFLQGLPTPGRLTDPQGRQNGWQIEPGHMEDRDLKFVDVVWSTISDKADRARVYAMGHSNGGSFTYLLWATRGDIFSAFAPSAAVAGPKYGKLPPKPAFLVAGKKDELVKFEWQQLMIDSLRRSQTSGPGETIGQTVTIYRSEVGAPLAVYLHDGGHGYPSAATKLIADFFRTVGK